MAHQGLDAVLVQILEPQDLLGRESIVGTLDFDEAAAASVRVPEGQVWKS